jgi:hypothetical protein
MPINTDLNTAPYYDDFDITNKYHRVLFKPGFSVQARELTQLQTILQNQIEQFGDNIYKEGSIIKGVTFTELDNLSYVKVVDGVTPTNYLERIETPSVDITEEYYYELENENGLVALIVSASNGFQSRAPDLNTFYINYLNTTDLDQKTFSPGESLNIREYVIISEIVNGSIQEEIVDNGIVFTTTVASFSTPIGKSFGINCSEGIVFQKGHFLFVEAQTIILVKYLTEGLLPSAIQEPDGISIGFVVDEEIITSQIDSSLLDNANGSPNENAPGADRLKLSPRLVSIDTTEAETDETFFILIRYENGSIVQIRDVSQFNSISTEIAKRTYETHGDYVTKSFNFDFVRRNDVINIVAGEGVVYAKGFRVENSGERFFPLEEISETIVQNNHPISFGYSGYCKIISHTGRIDIGTYQKVNLLNSGETQIGSAIVKNYVEDKIYLFGIRMNVGQRFDDVSYVSKSTFGKVAIEPKLIDSTKSTLVFDTGMFSVKEIDDFSLSIRKQANNISINANGEITLSAGVGEAFNEFSTKDVLVVNNTNTLIALDSVTLVDSNTIVIQATSATSDSATVYYNVQITPGAAKVKQKREVFVKLTHLEDKFKYTLGLPDVFDLISVVNAANTDIDYTDSFRLNFNQKDNFYDHSYIETIPGRNLPANNELLLVNIGVFEVDSSTGPHFFTINSYSGTDLVEIPFFETKDGKSLNLSSCVDFRPHRIPIVNYALTAGAANTISTSATIDLPDANTELFSSAINYTTPAINTSGTLDIEFYLNRIDLLTVDSYGRFSLVRGKESTRAVPPKVDDKTVIAEILIPGNPILTPTEASLENLLEYSVKVKPVGTKNYTMKEINKINEKVARLMYYTTLSTLETSTKNLLIKSENGLNRFKNGIIVDPFNDLSIANVKDPEFNSSVDLGERTLNPAVKTIPLNLKVKTLSDVQTFDDKNSIVTLASDSFKRIVSQPYATNFRTCTSNFYLYKGDGYLSPDYDVAYDTITTPVAAEIDLMTPFTDFVDGLQSFIPLTTTTNTLLQSTTTVDTNRNVTRTTTTDLFEELTNVFKIIEGKETTKPIGDFVSNIQFKPYIRSQEIRVAMFGLRPNTRHYFFFDGVSVNDNVAPATPTDDNNVKSTIRRTRSFGSVVRTNENGELFAILKIPAETFFVGDRELIVADVPSYDNIKSSSASRGSLIFRAYNFSIEKAGLTISTRQPEMKITSSTTTRSVTNRTVVRQDPPAEPTPIVPNFFGENNWNGVNPGDGTTGEDPIAQTFFIKNGLVRGAECLFVGRIDLFFKRKSSINGVTVMIREVINGFPSYEILPFSKVHLKSSEVLVSDDASLATTIIFDAPVRLDSEKEYCFVIQPDANDPDYLVFTSKVGGNDLQTGRPISQDWGDGVLFTSTNNRAWKSYQDEDIKFNLFRYNFNVGAGIVTLETEGLEFFTISDTTGKFINNELVYSFKGSSTYSVTLALDNNIITGVGLDSYDVGDYFYVENGTGIKDLLKISAITSPTEIIVDGFPTFAGTFNSRPVVVGRVVYFDYKEPTHIYLENSSARTGKIFATTESIYGIDSEATATIVSIDDLNLSYIQPMINRTTDSATNVLIRGKFIDPANPSNLPYSKDMRFTDKTTFQEKGVLIRSKSIDLSQEKNLKLEIALINNNIATTTPFIDIETAKLFAYVYHVSNDSATTSKYISKKVELKEGFDAEDFRLYLTAYRPKGSDVKAYIKIQNSDDSVSFSDNDWIELELIDGVNQFSSTNNINNFKEFVYEIPSANKEDGIVEYTNTIGTFSTYRSFAIKIELFSDNVALTPKILDYRGVAFE